MAQLNYKSSLAQYRRYLAVIREQPMFAASLGLVLSLMLVIILVSAALRPTLVAIASLLGDIRQQSEVEKKLDEKIAEVTAAQAVYLKNESRLKVLDEALPIGRKYAAWAIRLEDVASESGVKVAEWSLLEGKNFSVSLVGDVPELKRFLAALENLRRLVEIESVQLAKEKELTLIMKGVLKSYEEKQD
ncbi:MAG: hypothetical protein UX99_C0002G0055 [Candidatus Amesbacteria bacterium GW2011_GWB1_47_26]|uniref:Uncharacterized protein n=1 Tax=Candidatus Amesbacteria bacterium GW2011_GWC2_45_19 TaxID=1618366 RepID=A0A0G1PCK7_9BACT|nr:MAG: hypothetical protein UX05_C0004G0122 [Candidatus Amesbacteria bacterium GW2011_GWC2_45_19]KKU38781.1 MAG: hypothetical protein UX52_C0001G0063 [Candidatus Amesbacteria bacterium GW2011_GWA1_46_35]KKU69283.1 MAG: hypothetical protein UX93_C0002G0122 [Microgenomates group bacterium GW2011_GWC1_47_20]KKU75084.1 MAG: hypothetical protein UX99_C0002G0055 [Candidatus Amesbacteria bacterium GW2011_GWB1_47_26]KKU80381.1 MAG: hypothetical protein UY06_C0001G0009 [Candidatus Amesbacteria bacteriu